MRPGDRVRLRSDPGRIGVLTGKSRERPAGVVRYQVVFPDTTSWVPEDQIELLAEGPQGPIELLEAGRLGRSTDLRRALTHVRLAGRLANIIYSMDTTGTDFYAYQFKPVLKLLNSPTNGILIADEVGLGKTIEAGLIWTELRSRFDFRRLLVLCPAMLREKWKRELLVRFGVDAETLSAKETLDRLATGALDRPTRGFAIVASMQGLRPSSGWDDEEAPRAASSRLARFLSDRDQDPPLVDMLVIDEAHYLRNPETKTNHLGRLLRAVSEYVLLLSATPIHLKSNDLFHLLNLVDEDTFTHLQFFDDILSANAPLNRARDRVVRGRVDLAQLRNDLKEAAAHPLLAGNRQLTALIERPPDEKTVVSPAGLSDLARRLDRLNLLGHAVTRTRKREVTEWRVLRQAVSEPARMTDQESAFYNTVTQIVREFSQKSEAHEGFLLVTPQRQMSSSMPAALRLWQSRGHSNLEEIYEDFGFDANRSDEELGPLVSELIRRSAEFGDFETLKQADTKYRRLRTRLKAFLAEHPREKLILFSYFRATLSYLHERLAHDGISSIVLKGGMDDKDAVLR